MYATGAAVSSSTANSILKKNRSSIPQANGRQSEAIGALTARKKPCSDRVPLRPHDSAIGSGIELFLLQSRRLDFTVNPDSPNSQG